MNMLKKRKGDKNDVQIARKPMTGVIMGLALFCVCLVIPTTFAQAASPQASIRIDGSSTVFPITEAIAEEFHAIERTARVTIGISGTGGGFKKFCMGEIDMVNASRPIKATEIAACAAKKIDFVELPIAYDGIVVVVHPTNKWVDHLTVSDLKKMWEPAAQGKITHWNQVRPGWPNLEIHLSGPGVDSGTFDFFTEVIVGKSGAARGDYTASEDDNVLVHGVATDPGALGFFGLAYYEANKARLRAISIDDQNDTNGRSQVAATRENILEGRYRPLARPLFIYMAKPALARPVMVRFVDFYLKNAAAMATDTDGVALPETVLSQVRARFQKRTIGSAFSGAAAGATVADILAGR